MTPLRIVESGLRPPRAHLSMTEALCRRREAGMSPDTLRFQHFPPSAIIGRHQILGREVDLAWCAGQDVAIARRMTGGGAIVMGPGLLGWELVLSRTPLPGDLGAVTALLCEGLADGLARLGIAAHYRPRNDIEVEGRKISGTGGYFDGATLVFQGTVLVDLDPVLLTKALRLPAHKLGKRGLDTLVDRLVDLRALLGTPPPLPGVMDAVTAGLAGALKREPIVATLLPEEEAEAAAIHETEIGLDRFVNGADDHFPPEGRTLTRRVTPPGGTLDLAVKLRDGVETVEQVMITGDFFISPPRIIADLEAHLRYRRVDQLAMAARDFLTSHRATLLGMTIDDLAAAFHSLGDKQDEA